MTTPSEPLLPVEPEPPSRLKRGLLLATAGLAATLLVVGLMLGRARRPSPDESPKNGAVERGPARPPTREPGVRPAGTSPEALEERQARELYQAAEAFERAEPGDYERRAARWREVVTRFPTSSWARKADERQRAAAASLEAFLDREFDSTRKDAQALAAAGHFVDAIEIISAFKIAQTRELLRRRADLEIGSIENASRLGWNETLAKAKDLADRQSYGAAAALMESLAEGAIPEVAAQCRVALGQLRQAGDAQAREADSRRREEARKAFRDAAAPKLLGLVRARQYDEALRELGSAAGAGPKDEIAQERALVADAASFWESFLKALRARAGQDVTILLADGKRCSGRISRIQGDRIVLDAGDGTVEVPLDRLPADLLVAWTLGRTLPADDPVSYIKAALFFFCEGRDDLAKLYLATARELGGAVDGAEKAFRGGFLRAAMSIRK